MADEVRVSNADIAAAEAEVKAQQAANAEKIKAETEANVRKELESEAKLKQAETARLEMESKVKQQQEELNKLKASNDDLIRREVESRSKRIVNGESPFTPPNKANLAATLTPEQMKSVNERSFEALIKRGTTR